MDFGDAGTDELRMRREKSNAEIEIDGRTKTRYEWSQEQRRIETAVRAQKDIAIAAKASGDDVARREAQSKINALQDHYEKVSKAAGLDMQRDRMRVAGFRQVKTIEQLKNAAKSGIISSDDVPIPKTLGAKGINYDILSPDGERYFHYVEGTYVQRVKAFAGYGTRTPLHEGVADGLTKEFGGDPAKWRHVKGEGVIDDDGEDVRAEVYWFQEESVGQVKHRIKKWLE